MLHVDDLHVHFGDVHAVRGVSFSIARGEALALVGESGSGKSVTAQALIGLLPQQTAHCNAKRMVYNGTALHTLSERCMRSIRGKEIAMIFQDPLSALNPTLRVGSQIAEALRIHALQSRRGAWERALNLLQQVELNNPEELAMRYPHQLSGGQRQRVAIAAALACDPKLLIADEPTTALDADVQGEILQLLQRLQRERGMSLLLITHDLDSVQQLCSRTLVMYAGRIIEERASDALISAPRHPYTEALLRARPGSGTLQAIEGSPPDLRQTMQGCAFAPRCRHAMQVCARKQPPVEKQSACWLEHGGERQPDTASSSEVVRAAPGSEQLLAVDGLTKRFGQQTVVDKLSFTIKTGETLGVLGPSGCGKSTVARCLMGLYSIDEGSIHFNTKQPKREMQMVFQDPYASLNPRQTVLDAIAEPIDIHTPLSQRARQRRVKELLDAVGLLPEHLQRYPHEFSGGQRQRICIARALALEPKLILLDEAVSALDVSIQAQILTLLLKLQRERGLSYLFISHDRAVVEHVSHRILSL